MVGEDPNGDRGDGGMAGGKNQARAKGEKYLYSSTKAEGAEGAVLCTSH